MIILLTTIGFGDARTKQEQQPAQNRPPGQISALRRSEQSKDPGASPSPASVVGAGMTPETRSALYLLSRSSASHGVINNQDEHSIN
jgi:hypothetical protein